MDDKLVLTAIKQFKITSEVIGYEPLGNGLINTTWIVNTESGKKYVLQMINNSVFPNVDALMRNISIVSDQLYDKGMISLHLVNSIDDSNYVKIDERYFRMYRFISNTRSYDVSDDLQIIESAGNYLGQFHLALSDIDVKEISETIKDFHNTPKRFEFFLKQIANANKERLKEAEEEVNFLLSFQDKVGEVEKGLANGYILPRVTHNDTKLNNYLFDEENKKAVCLVDFDTIMVSSALYDFGDATRYLCNKAGESEKDLSKVFFDLELYEAYAKGYLEKGKYFLNKKEIELLPYSSLLMAVELSIRFLGDYLSNDVYFKISYEKENLVRARNQIKIVKDIQEKYKKMQDIISKYVQ